MTKYKKILKILKNKFIFDPEYCRGWGTTEIAFFETSLTEEERNLLKEYFKDEEN